MDRNRDPVAEAADGDADLYDVATWEERTSIDGLATALYWLITRSARVVVVLTALVLLLLVIGFGTLTSGEIGILTVLSVVPALALAGYVWYSDVTTSEPLSLLVATFLLGVLTANFAAVLNSVARAPFQAFGFVGTALFFFLVVGPVEETVKLLAVRLYAYGSDRFDAVIDGAVYGAMAGLGFAFIENALYISQQVDPAQLDLGLGLIGMGGGITAVRALAGPGHVIYSAFAGYYLGLAKYNPENRGPIIIKGLLIASLIHATYNTTVGIGSGVIQLVTGLPSLAAFVVWIVLYDGLFIALLFRKIRRYQRAHAEAHAGQDVAADDLSVDSTEFDA